MTEQAAVLQVDQQEPLTITRHLTAWMIGAAEQDLRAMARRAERLHITPPVWSVDWSSPVERRFVITTHGEDERTSSGIEVHEGAGEVWDTAHRVQFYPLTITSVPVMLGGWQIRALLSPLAVGEGEEPINLVSTLGERDENGDAVAIPERFRTSAPTCDHCGKVRRRARVFVLYHSDGRWVQVGSGCLNDYTGLITPNGIVNWYGDLCDWMGGMTGAEREPYGGGLRSDWSSDTSRDNYLAYCARDVRMIGYTTRAEADEQQDLARNHQPYDPIRIRTTGERAWAQMRRVAEAVAAERTADLTAYDYPSDDDMDAAGTVRAWALALPADQVARNDYLGNVRAAMLVEKVTTRTAGVLASAYTARDNWIARQERYEVENRLRAERDAERAEKVANAQPLVAGRQQIRGTVLSGRVADTHFGMVTKILVEMEDGNRVWGTAPAYLLDEVWEELLYGVEGTSFQIRDEDVVAAARGREVEFRGTVQPKEDDPHFGFYSRPS